MLTLQVEVLDLLLNNYTDEQITNLINKFADPDINSFLNTTPKAVLEEIRHEYDERVTEAARVHQLQEDRAKAEGHITKLTKRTNNY